MSVVCFLTYVLSRRELAAAQAEVAELRSQVCCECLVYHLCSSSILQLSSMETDYRSREVGEFFDLLF